ncbi:methylated-DNA--[protein]-cysteine S-methyltransferase [Psychrobacillus psychrodurans]|jgi:methylated-DNA-[protein]-cysteine S-methyltransferase|uniref:methylated-DNA--[protein]-cysteine S-methyltransferase n=1 Tax=Psychrobacillus TaxID=1221880 RepID=UPI0008E89CCE|nr:methylated-DNA--[protein]-cysteine S-methyltransferase [Psychrobacillus psychrodurans]MCK1997844.1 methylated-DNA--[protein]-cysteine S-methyltransferase [Psychrobacillus psychrodurans]MCZ8541027.1 methylated-DNA--[protein]-cysteine S-methyltransferase [Psychrobacillus psychrodurans]SFM83019.1 methylated-DNA-[protein]-cysteine S-methyltransferase [Psychrobacillus psychrodurans]
MDKLYTLDYKSPIGILEIIGTDQAISSILFVEREEMENKVQEETPQVLKDCLVQIDEYFKGELHEFTFPYVMNGTIFQKSVWNALKSISYAKTGSYKDIAISIGNEKAIRAVGSANGRNKLTIVVPCHRIIGTNGKLTGYAGGLWRKEWLLQHEQKVKNKRF